MRFQSSQTGLLFAKYARHSHLQLFAGHMHLHDSSSRKTQHFKNKPHFPRLKLFRVLPNQFILPRVLSVGPSHPQSPRPDVALIPPYLSTQIYMVSFSHTCFFYSLSLPRMRIPLPHWQAVCLSKSRSPTTLKTCFKVSNTMILTLK